MKQYSRKPVKPVCTIGLDLVDGEKAMPKPTLDHPVRATKRLFLPPAMEVASYAVRHNLGDFSVYSSAYILGVSGRWWEWNPRLTLTALAPCYGS